MIISECILNTHLVRICIEKQRETLYIVRTPKVGHFICDTRRFDIWKGSLAGLGQSCTPLCELARLDWTSDAFGYSPPDQSMLLMKGIYRRQQLCSATDLHFMSLSELRNKVTEVKHRNNWAAGRP